MKIALSVAALACFLSGASVTARAQNNSGNPFAYVVTSEYVGGDPATVYQSAGGPPPTAAVELLIDASFQVTNTDTRTRLAGPGYTVWCAATLNGGGGFVIQNQEINGWNGNMYAGQVIVFEEDCSATGNIIAGSYTANGTADIHDSKTLDWDDTVTGSVPFTIN